MRRSIADRMLEHWASWRITRELYSGTGPSAIVRFREPAGTARIGSHPLYLGRCDRKLAALNTDLCLALGHRDICVLLMLYGLPGDEGLKMRQYGLSPAGVDDIKHRARVVALGHIPHTVKTGAREEDHEPRAQDTG